MPTLSAYCRIEQPHAVCLPTPLRTGHTKLISPSRESVVEVPEILQLARVLLMGQGFLHLTPISCRPSHRPAAPLIHLLPAIPARIGPLLQPRASILISPLMLAKAACIPTKTNHPYIPRDFDRCSSFSLHIRFPLLSRFEPGTWTMES
jgi:hypothetical protein